MLSDDLFASIEGCAQSKLGAGVRARSLKKKAQRSKAGEMSHV